MQSGLQNLFAGLGIAYTIFLFAIAYYADRFAKRGRAKFLRSSLVYTLSLSVYCTSWTFFGAVGSAARNGLEFLAIYIGPSLVFFAWWMILRKLVILGRSQNITSIADFLSSRFGRSNSIAVLVTLISLLAITPYISLQLQSIALSFGHLFAGANELGGSSVVAFLSAIGLAIFTILFGTRSANINERQAGVVIAIAVESIVKLLAIVLVGLFAIAQFGSIGEIFASDAAHELLAKPIFTDRWFAIVSLSFMAIITLPRMFHLIVVENESPEHLRTASWAFPLYLFILSIFVLPIALLGRSVIDPGANPDYYLISLPLAFDQEWLALIAWLGGFSAATSMIIVSTISVSVMVTNHIAMPLWLDARGNRQDPEDVRVALLRTRRIAIILIMLLGYGYFEMSGSGASLASIGLIAFAGVAQLFPSLMAALFWHGASRLGALTAMLFGAMIWLFTLYMPHVSASSTYMMNWQDNGIFGLAWLKPYALFGSQFDDPLLHSVFWSLFVNALTLILVSSLTKQRPMERLLANRFVGSLNPRTVQGTLQRQSNSSTEDFLFLAQRVLGERAADQVFRAAARAQGHGEDYPVLTDAFIETLERKFSGVVGGAAAHTLVSQLIGERSVPVFETIKLADETVQNVEYARALEAQSQEIERTARALREANSRLISLDAQKDAFLSQVSHELRTPMTAIRSVTEILRDSEEIAPGERQRMLSIIAQENERLTAMLDEILDLSYLESGRVRMKMDRHAVTDCIEHAVHSTEGLWRERGLMIRRDYDRRALYVDCDFNRLIQVFINLITNAVKYVANDEPELTISVRLRRDKVEIDFTDNGAGVPSDVQPHIFEKFSRGSAEEVAGSAGLGLAISREIVENHGGTLTLVSAKNGARFRVRLPQAKDPRA